MDKRLTLITLALVACAGTGCASKFNRENFNMIRVGMDAREDVREILGEPRREMGDVWLYDDTDKHLNAQIFFDDSGRVVSKEWMNAETAEWDGRSPYTDPPAEGEVREESTTTERWDVD